MAGNKISVQPEATSGFNTREDTIPQDPPQLDIQPEPQPAPGKQVLEKTTSISKSIINFSYLAFALAGILACTNLNIIDIDKYMKFLESFTTIWAPLVFTVGAGRAAKNYFDVKKTVDLTNIMSTSSTSRKS